MRKILALVILSAFTAASTAAQQPPPDAKPAWTTLPDPISQNALPNFQTPAEWAGRLGKAMKQPELVLGGEAAGWLADIHDGRKAVAEQARVQANDAMKRDLYAAGVNTFNWNDCAFKPTTCVDTYQHFSPQTRKAIDAYFDAQDRYLSWTDIGNVTGKGWTAEEVAGVVEKAVSSGADKLAAYLTDEADKHSGERKGEDLAMDAAAAKASQKLDEFDKGIVQHVAPGQSGTATAADARVPTDAELRAAADAASSQGASIVQANAQAQKPAPEASFADQTAVSVNQELHRLDDNARSVNQTFDSDSERAARQAAALDQQAAAWLRALLGAPQPAPKPYTPASTATPAAAAPPTLRPPTPAAKPTPKADHCPNGVFVCPNGRSWKDCTRPEKYACPPPGAIPTKK